MKSNFIYLLTFIIVMASCSKNDDNIDAKEFTNSNKIIVSQDFEFEGKVYTLSVDVTDPNNFSPIKNKDFNKLSEIFDFPNLTTVFNLESKVIYLYSNEEEYKKSFSMNSKIVEENLYPDDPYSGGGGSGGGSTGSSLQSYANLHARGYLSNSGWILSISGNYNYSNYTNYISDLNNVPLKFVLNSNYASRSIYNSNNYNVNDDVSSLIVQNMVVKVYEHQNKGGRLWVINALNTKYQHNDLNKIIDYDWTGIFGHSWNDEISSIEARIYEF